MELKDRKFIKNSNIKLPGFEDGVSPYQQIMNNGGFNQSARSSISQGGVNNLPNTANEIKIGNVNQSNSIPLNANVVSAIGQSLPQAIGFIGENIYAHQYGKGLSELNNQAGFDSGSFGGIGYEKLNPIDENREMKEVRSLGNSNTLKLAGSGAALGASIGSFAGPVGSAVGGILGGIGGLAGGLWGASNKARKARREIRAQHKFAENYNDFNMSGAATQYLQLNNLQKEGDYRNLVLYAKDGKMPSFNNGKSVHTAFGSAKVGLNSWGSSGETIVDTLTGAFHVMPGKPNFKDTMPMFARGRDAVLSNHGASQYFLATHDLGGALAMDYMYRANDSNTYKNGKLPRCKEGMFGNIIPSSLGAMMSIGLLLDAKNQDIASPNIYASNPYELSALNTLAGLRINEYPIVNRLNQLRAESDYAIDNSGGLSGGQRARIRAANLATTQRNIADLLSNVQAQNNQYKSQFANALMLLGTQKAQRQQQANQFRADMTARAHAARQQGILMGWQNLLSQIQGFYANEFKRRQFNDTMDLYRQDQKLLQDRFNAEFPNYGSTTKRYFTPPVTIPQLNAMGGGLSKMLNQYMGNSYLEDLLRRSKGIKLR